MFVSKFMICTLFKKTITLTLTPAPLPFITLLTLYGCQMNATNVTICFQCTRYNMLIRMWLWPVVMY